MRPIIRISSLIACLLMVSACEGPFIFAPGGELNGTVSAFPDTWQFEAISELAQLETRPEDPYSINLVYVQLDGALYVYAGDTRTAWVQHIEQNPLVRLRVEDKIYPARAVRVDDNDEFMKFAAIWASRSVFQRDPTQFEEVWLYRLEAR